MLSHNSMHIVALLRTIVHHSRFNSGQMARIARNCLYTPLLVGLIRSSPLSSCWNLAHIIDLEKADATFKNGLLTVTVPLAERFEDVKVAIK